MTGLPERTFLLTATAYRRGLCIDCQQVKPEPAMPRCWPCHAGFTGIKLTREQRRQASIRSMAGVIPGTAVFVIATIIVELRLASEAPLGSPA